MSQWNKIAKFHSEFGRKSLPIFAHLALLCIERAYVNIVDIEKVIDEFSSKKKKKFIPSSFSNRFLYQNMLVIYFESCKESELVNSVLSKGNLNLTY